MCTLPNNPERILGHSALKPEGFYTTGYMPGGPVAGLSNGASWGWGMVGFIERVE